ncbi:MAG: Mth938-like domain-containing protein [Janthinobacterium lividum]
MKLQQESNAELNNVTGYGRGYVEVNKERFTHSIVLFPQGPVVPWPVGGFDTLRPADFDLLAQASPELVLFGTGARLRFGHPRLFAALSAQRIGVETMDLSAACRTFNILIGEGRRAAAALLIEPD